MIGIIERGGDMIAFADKDRARLIGAIPDILYALETALDVMECRKVGLGGSQALARAAIAKAKG
jgi:hypothetical protein